MMKNSASGLRRGVRIAGLGAAAAALLGVMSTGAASADTFIPLPDGSKTGPNVTLTRTAESALSSPSLAANGVGRVAWVSGTVVADVKGIKDVTDVPDANNTTNNAGTYNGTNASTTHGVSRVSTGYIVGCQVDITGLSANPSFSLGLDSLSASAGLTVPLASGEVKYVPLGGKDIKKDGVYALQYQDSELQVQKCGGFAQARSYSVVEIVGNDYSKTVLYGAPFSIG
ncbi:MULTISPECIES: MspA family porin [unclassified Rhodococcus (in: high G+C Gram-positive bacteria)]|uniref:MspA family porin n=1 Tax=unclassified Rhodococcus (in: high G+C Gram-positive bacteria) TaxID=192944 RepID=UPI0016399F38|nr:MULTISPECIES: MspA family porin [unclassified Rhodococcus (in: high G+C Gram-positive bacteria)]MBC2640612.1 MspA family porin [Rhodococcus sp. 3A]MBC2894643.1 MspA family porin [Rhodococcus sp. 4CII]